MSKLLVLPRKPADANAFDDSDDRTCVPLAKTMPGLVRYEVDRGPVKSLAGDAAHHLVATHEFADRAALDAASRSDEGRATAADVSNFARAGVEMLV